MYGYGFEKEKVKHWAELIRQRGFRARVVPLSRDKVLGKGRYGLFIHPKSDNRIRWNDGQWAGMNTWQTLGDGISKRTISSTMPDGTKTEAYLLRFPNREFSMSRQFFSGATSDVGIRVFNKEKDEDELERMVREQLGLTEDDVEILEFNAGFQDDNDDDEQWWEEDFGYDPTKEFTFEAIQEKQMREEKEKRLATCDSCGAGIRFEGDCPGKFGGQCPQDVPEDEIDDYYAEEEEDPYGAMMDSIGYNDSAYPGISPMVLLGYEGGGAGEAIDEKQFNEYIDLAQEYNRKHMERARAFLSGNGRFGEFKEFAEEFGEPDSVGDVIALPLVTVKGYDPKRERRSDQPFGINTIYNWFIHPDAIEAIAGDSLVPKAERAFIDSFSGYYGDEEIFQDEQMNNFDQTYMDERLGEIILNAEDWFERDEVVPEIFAVGTDIGFFDRRGVILGVRLTPFDAPPGVEKFPRFMRDLFEDRTQQTDEGFNAISQVYYRGEKLFGSDSPFDASSLDFNTESDNLIAFADDIQTLNEAEISIIYGNDADLISKEEAKKALEIINEDNIDDRLDIDKFRDIVGARANLSREEYIEKTGGYRYQSLYEGNGDGRRRSF